MNFLLAHPGVTIVVLLVPALLLRWFLVPKDRKRTGWLLVAITLVEPMGMATELTANALSSLRPFKYDLYVYEFDIFFGSPSFRIGQEVSRHVWLHNLVSISYGLLPMAMFSVVLVYLRFDTKQEAIRVVLTFALLFFGGALVYLIIPVSGPVYAFHSFPAFPAPFIAHPLALDAPPNAIPSGHTGAALLILWFLRKWRVGFVVGLAFLGLTVLATLGSGQHYLFDSLCAGPFAVLIVRLESRVATAINRRKLNEEPCIAIPVAAGE